MQHNQNTKKSDTKGIRKPLCDNLGNADHTLTLISSLRNEVVE